ncbi:tail fiber protein [Bacillus phage BSTP8]|nr:hypothetical protein BSP19_065 [Bacillus phage BSP19]QQO90081.1 tail fiber protein [Bacillus phage BSTP5]QRI44370.1 tail fiber protein [Bacillus phage BSTP8]QRI44397.1 tail fiber protein [Bacillus phage BSTP10]QRI44527.1 tail fiber protein [Bacillus phage BSTP12]
MAERDANGGVHITLREIYDSVQNVDKSVRELQNRFEDVREQGEEIKQLKLELQAQTEKIQTTTTIANEAHAMSTKHDNNISWLWKTMVAAFLTAFITGIVGITVSVVKSSIEPKPSTEINVPANDKNPNNN